MAHKLECHEVAVRLRLSPEIIEALEDDDYEKLPGAGYVFGYLRGYARLLHLDEELLIACYRSRIESDSHLRPLPNPGGQVTSRSRGIRAISYALGVSLVFLLLSYWWQWQERGDGAPIAEDVQEPSLTEIAEHEPSAREPTDWERMLAGEYYASFSQLWDMLPTEETLSLPGLLTLALDDECWIEIYDANDVPLLIKLGQPGEHFSLDARLPLSVVLGNAHAVTLTLNGVVQDVRSQAHGSVARLNLEAPLP